MTFKAFILGMLATFGLPWLFAIVLPFAEMRGLESPQLDEEGGYYDPGRAERISEGSKVYGQEGCAVCHSQVVRPTYAGWDVHRGEWAGLRASPDQPDDTRRETLPSDYFDEAVAHIGEARNGPDLSNFGRRVEFYQKGKEISAEQWVYLHLYNPRGVKNYKDDQFIPAKSTCPSKRSLFDQVPLYQAGNDALALEANEEGFAVIPNDRGRRLVGYLLSLKKDTLGQPLPKDWTFTREAPKAE